MPQYCRPSLSFIICLSRTLDYEYNFKYHCLKIKIFSSGIKLVSKKSMNIPPLFFSNLAQTDNKFESIAYCRKHQYGVSLLGTAVPEQIGPRKLL